MLFSDALRSTLGPFVDEVRKQLCRFFLRKIYFYVSGFSVSDDDDVQQAHGAHCFDGKVLVVATLCEEIDKVVVFFPHKI